MMDDIMPTDEIYSAQEPDKFILGSLVIHGIIESECSDIVNLMILEANLGIYDGISQRIFGNVFSVSSKPVPE